MSYSEKDIQKLIQQSVHPWLIKSSGRVIGPFSKQEIEEKLKTREVVPLDEVAKPLDRWRYLRDEPTFQNVVDSVKSDVNRDNEQTMTSSVSGDTDEFTMTEEMKEGETVTDSITEEALEFQDPRTQSWSSQGLAEVVEESAAPVSYGYQSDRNIESELKQTSRRGWLFTGLFILVVAWIVFQSGPSKDQAPTGRLSQNVELGMKAYQVGAFRPAIGYFKKALALDAKNTEVILRMTPLLTQYENDYVYSRKILGDVLNYQVEKRYLLNANVNLALTYLMEGRQTDSFKYLQDASRTDELYLPLLANMAAYYYLGDRYDQTVQSYEKARVHTRLEGSLVMLGVMAYIKKHEIEPTREDFLSSAKSAIDDYLRQSYSYRQEFLLVRAYVSMLQEGQVDPGVVRSILETDPYLLEDHWLNPQVYQRHMNWAELYPWCESIYESSDKSAIFEGLLGLCLLKADKDLEAVSVIGNALEKDPNDAVLLGLKGYQLIRSRDESKGLGILTHVLPESTSPLSQILLARHCQSAGTEEGNCALSHWQKLLQQDPQNLSALGGVAEIYREMGRDPEALRIVERGLNRAPRYLPFLRVRYQAEDSWKPSQ